MPTLSELVNEEADRAEAEFPDDDDDAATDGEPSPEEADGEHDEPDDTHDDTEASASPPAGASAPDLAPIGPEEIAKAEKARDAQRRKLAGILGEAYVAHDCPLCSALGFLPDLPPAGTVLETVYGGDGVEFIMRPPEVEPEYIEAPDKTACEWCEALGFVLTGSRNPHARVAPCTKCSGNGWVIKAADEALQPAAPVGVAPAPSGYPEAPPGVGLDAWGRPFGHKHWGVPPASIPG